MKKINYFSQTLLVGAVALTLTALASIASADNVPQVVSVIRVTGQARFQAMGDHGWQTLHVGDVLKPGTTIQTADKSSVDILMGDKTSMPSVSPVSVSAPSPTSTPPPNGSNGGDSGPKANIVRIFASSVLTVDKLILERTGVDEVAETQLDLRAGQIMGNVKKLSASSRYEVKIPNGVAGIRGTVYVISASGTVYVLEGEVVVSYMGANGDVYTKTISAGQTFDPSIPGGGVGAIPPGIEHIFLEILKFLHVPNSGPTTIRLPDNTLIYISPLGGNGRPRGSSSGSPTPPVPPTP